MMTRNWMLLMGGLLPWIAMGQPLALKETTRSLQAGVAKVDITPEEPVRLSGYASRKEPTAEVRRRLFARALAVGGEGHPVLWVTFDGIGTPGWMRDALAERLHQKVGLPTENVAVCATHTHGGPQLKGVLPNMFMAPLPGEQEEAVSRYTDELLDRLERISLEALSKRQPCQVDHGVGTATFAINRRALRDGKWTGIGHQPDGPVDHSVSVLRVRDAQGRLVALMSNYACHCTTLGGGLNAFHGDWADVACTELEAAHPDCVAMVSIGCGADQNPSPRGEESHVLAHGKALASAVDEVLKSEMRPIRGLPEARYRSIDLRFDPMPDREELLRRVQAKGDTMLMKLLLARVDSGEDVPTTLSYPVQTWNFGEDLAVVFLAGEVVVDYALRLKRELRAERLWVNAYANDAPCYIASRRLYAEGGYEVDRSMVYYGQPNRLAMDTEDRIVDEVLKQLPHPFDSEETQASIPPPMSPAQALQAVQVLPEFEVALAASEPLVQDPVDVAWGPDLRMWVVEMADYPLGIDGQGKPGGRIRVLEDEDGDGIYERGHLFAEGLRFPNSVMPWKDGVLVTSVPNILYLEDTDGDGRADREEVLFRGFSVGNPQHLAAGLQWGLDHWIYAQHGDSDDAVESVRTGQRLNLNRRDFRFQPETGLLDAQSGPSQYGRHRDDWGHWFGCSNSRPGWYYALEDAYLRRNPHVRYPDAMVHLPVIPGASPVYPASKTLRRFNDYDAENRFTSACGHYIFRGPGLGEEVRGSAFVCEPVHNLVSRSVLESQGLIFRSRRPAGEQDREFFASADNWSRPVNVREGPDGALYVVDMYRLVIEHPQWIPEDWQRRLDLRAGEVMGRIYRVTKRGASPQAKPSPLNDLSPAELVGELETLMGWRRDLVHQMLMWHQDRSVGPQLRDLITQSNFPEVRLQSLAVLDGLNILEEEDLLRGLRDPHPGVRRHAVRLCEGRLSHPSTLSTQVLGLAMDEDIEVRQQVALSIGGMAHPDVAEVLAHLLLLSPKDPYMVACILSSAVPSLADLFQVLDREDSWSVLESGTLANLVRTAVGAGQTQLIRHLVEASLESGLEQGKPAGVRLIQAVVDAQGSRGRLLSDWISRESSQPSAIRLSRWFASLPKRLSDPSVSMESKLSGVFLLGRAAKDDTGELNWLAGKLNLNQPETLQSAILRRLSESGNARVGDWLIGAWDRLGPMGRDRVLDTLLARASWTILWLGKAVDHPEWLLSLSASQKSTLLHHSDAKVREAASKVLQAPETGRAELVARYEAECRGLQGDGGKGRELFATLCASCHRVGDVGHDVGPDLASVAGWAPEAWMEAVLDPNRAIESRFARYDIESTQGEAVSGVITRESGSGIELAMANGLKQFLPRDQVRSLRVSPFSLMPEGLEQGLSAQGLMDVMAFVRQHAGSAVVVASGDGNWRLQSSLAVFQGPSVARDDSMGSVSWIGPEDSVQWRVAGLRPGEYDLFMDAAVARRYEGYPFVLTFGTYAQEGAIEFTGGLQRFRKRKFATLRLPEGAEEMVVRFSHGMSGADVAIREIRIAPAHHVSADPVR